MKHFLYLLSTTALLIFSQAVQGQNAFEKFYSYTDVNIGATLKCAAVAENYDILCAGSNTTGTFICRMDSSGNLMWSTGYETPENYYTDGAVAIIETNDGGIAIAGAHNVSSHSKIFVSKTDSDGHVLWTIGINAISVSATGILEDQDGNLFVTASGACFGRSFLVIKLDSSGAFIWKKAYMTIGGGPNDIIMSADGNLVMAGSTFDGATFIPAICKITTDGTQIFGYNYAQGINEYAWAEKITELPDGRFVITGTVGETDPNYTAIFVALIDENGNLLWEKIIGDPANMDGPNNAKGVIYTNQGTLLISAEMAMFSSQSERVLIEMDLAGNVLQAQRLVEDPINWVYNHLLLEGPQNEVYSLCASYGIQFLRFSDDLSNICNNTALTLTATNFSPIQSPNVSVISPLVGPQEFSFVEQTMATTTEVKCQYLEVSEEENQNQISIFPNPSNGTFTFNGQPGNFCLYDLSGNLVFETLLSGSSELLNLDLKSGIYLWKCTSANSIQSGKISIL